MLWSSASNDAASWVASNWEWPGKLAEASAGLYRHVQVTLPEVGSTVVGAVAQLPGGPPPSSSGSTNEVETVAAVVAVVTLTILAWQLFERRRSKRARSNDLIPRNWPVDPSAVANGAELMRAFEYLALLRLGIEARTRNHLAIAYRLGGASGLDDHRREAATELARLYERARYQPNAPEFGEADLAAARRDLTLLAGAAA